jgi:hypothetical protein
MLMPVAMVMNMLMPMLGAGSIGVLRFAMKSDRLDLFEILRATVVWQEKGGAEDQPKPDTG